MENRGNLKMSLGILGLFTLLGLIAWLYQLSNGLIVTGMRNVVSWGLYITSFMFFVGLSAGGLIVSSSATVFDIPAFKAVAKPAVILSTVCIILAGMFIIVDLGSPERIFYLLIHPQFQSPLIWDVVVIAVYLIVSLLYLRQMTRPAPDQGKLATLSAVALPAAVLVHSVTAWIFGLQIARVSWHSALMAPLFVASALDSGLALLILVLAGLEQVSDYKVEPRLYARLAGLLAVFVAVDAFFVLSEMLTAAYPGEESMMAALGLLTSGPLAPFFWVQVILGLLVPFVLLASPAGRQSKSRIMAAAALIILGVFCKRVWLLFSSFLIPPVAGAPGVTLGQAPASATAKIDMWAMTGSYTPTLVEWAIFLGIISFGAIVFIVASRRLLWSGEETVRAVSAAPTAAK
ncbi:NrfD/PsrC family molybdoenzyme membrane anchor subunit [Anaeroselena agilis]|uniref:Polysulfide reductase NrfD n=1 Tax=Anaeroselena agilis TaxID=3063788 RepID=A0ABU3NZ87_9FIRM|nr:polysulfide reductase NrfD [Selenomonadales bacterium 4137-cl]